MRSAIQVEAFAENAKLPVTSFHHLGHLDLDSNITAKYLHGKRTETRMA